MSEARQTRRPPRSTRSRLQGFVSGASAHWSAVHDTVRIADVVGATMPDSAATACSSLYVC